MSELDDVRYYYYRDTAHRPMVTLCRVTNGAREIGYGWAICSSRDIPCKATGRRIALERACAALRPLGNGIALSCHFDAPAVFRWARSLERDEALMTLMTCNASSLRYMLRSAVYCAAWLPMSMRVGSTGEAHANTP